MTNQIKEAGTPITPLKTKTAACAAVFWAPKFFAISASVQAECYFYVNLRRDWLVVFSAWLEAPRFHGFDGLFIQS
jgi:hypothetical protein